MTLNVTSSIRKVKEAFIARNSEGANIVKNVIHCHSFLEDKPKWKTFFENEDNDNKKKCESPSGQKKAKEKASDQELVEKITSHTDENAAKKARHLEKKETFMTQVGMSMQMVTTVGDPLK